MVEKKFKICDFCNNDDNDEISKAYFTCELCGKDFCVECGSEDRGLTFDLDNGNDVKIFCEESPICNSCYDSFEKVFKNKEFRKKVEEVIKEEVKKLILVNSLKGKGKK